ncbi:YheT family hydrolase [Fulvivirga sedimenti]|uniref:Alpha/beta fold hydrolase n=1 Tax=Fulvivirga sedimenti TaxID=2879465 RepID=A0A9X1KW51_9BACT|nr:alpha/beta fold hydrolase [Fulvivirga sedimenti]MCA6073609.1 alpha/beta fold hydrolase [Fulvivirga sedimenti]
MDEYKAPQIYISPHLETIIPALFRRVKDVIYQRERIETPDGDFLDLDWIRDNRDHLIIISHGLEGDSQRPYIKGMARAFSKKGYDILAWNFRGCSGEMNRKPRFYHSGATEDLRHIISHALKNGYEKISLVGFSLGGNLTLKYLGEGSVPAQIQNAVTFSVPLHLLSSCEQISQPGNWMYSRRFLVNLKEKIRLKEAALPGSMDVTLLDNIKTLIDFDNAYTAPLHGYRDAVDYYEKCSALYFLDKIETPTLLINARNDPFLSEKCYPVTELADHPYITFRVPHQGGHVGFTSFNPHGVFWSEQQAIHFVEGH